MTGGAKNVCYVNFHCHQIHAGEIGLCSVPAAEWEKRSCADGRFFSLQYHPWTAAADPGVDDIVLGRMLGEADALGEIGLDRACDTPWHVQLKWFERLLTAGAALRKPLVLHEVRAQSEILAMLKGYPGKIMIHHAPCRRGKYEAYLERGFLLSYGGTPPDGVPLDCCGLESDEGSAEELAAHYGETARRRDLGLEELVARMKCNFFIFLEKDGRIS